MKVIIEPCWCISSFFPFSATAGVSAGFWWCLFGAELVYLLIYLPHESFAGWALLICDLAYVTAEKFYRHCLLGSWGSGESNFVTRVENGRVVI